MKSYTVFRRVKNGNYRYETQGDVDLASFATKAEAIAYARNLNDFVDKLILVGVQMTSYHEFAVRANRITEDGMLKAIPVRFQGDLGEYETEDDDETHKAVEA